MPQWGNTDDAANSVIWSPALVNQEPTRANANALFGNTTASAVVSGKAVGVFGVNDAEAESAPVSSPGWQLRTEGTGGRAGRVSFETLVAMSGLTGDGDAGVISNFAILFLSQPQDVTVDDGDPATFTVSVETAPAGQTVTYLWQVDTAANGTFVNVAAAGVYSNVTTATLSISDASGLDGQRYRAVVSGTNATSNTSDFATLTVIA